MVNINSLERDGLRQAELCPRNTMMKSSGPGGGGPPRGGLSALGSCVKSTSNISRICTISSLISKKPLTKFGMQPYGPPCGSTISVQI